MTSFNTDDFQLTAQHLTRGLGEDDFSRYAGFLVPTLYLSDLPHWQNLRDTETLTGDQLHDRAQAVFDALAPYHAFQSMGGPFEDFQAEALARSPFPSTLFLRDIVDNKQGAAFPMGLRAFRDGPFPVYEVATVSAAVIIQYKFDDPLLPFWAQKLALPAHVITQHPQDPQSYIVNSLHEAGHLRKWQCRCPVTAWSFYDEAASDDFAYCTALRGGVDPALIQEDIGARYFSMLAGKPLYWFADTVAMIMAGQTPAGYWDTITAVMEMRARLVLHMLDDKNKDMPIKDLRDNLLEIDGRPTGAVLSPSLLKTTHQAVHMSGELLAYWRHEKPFELLGMLKDLSQDAKALSPLARKFAIKITKVAERFNPALTTRPAPQPRQAPAQQAVP